MQIAIDCMKKIECDKWGKACARESYGSTRVAISFQR